ncbi:hypothetical protein ZIOFF_005764 [Zingiber officinale]|uniref:PDZ domain-containing protein n=1 Tax=Zingiber officinale TaxID=94328 RepID=A0A8J5M4I8_ZINOF|nr:hypothetical protein ZIOFF_005764 [Zingiber officinale]
MSVLASNRPPLRVFRDPSCVGRRELLSNSVSSISSRRATTPAPDLHLASRSTEEQSLDLTEIMFSLFPFTTRRVLFSTTTFSLFLHTTKHLSDWCNGLGLGCKCSLNSSLDDELEGNLHKRTLTIKLFYLLLANEVTRRDCQDNITIGKIRVTTRKPMAMIGKLEMPYKNIWLLENYGTTLAHGWLIAMHLLANRQIMQPPLQQMHSNEPSMSLYSSYTIEIMEHIGDHLSQRVLYVASDAHLITERICGLLAATCHCKRSDYPRVAHALGDSSVTTEDVASRVFLSGPLFPSEERTVEIFEKNTYSVVNIFDVTLRPRLNATGSIEVPEGNGSGVVWDDNGHIVTNYHVVGNALSRSPGPGQVVARVNILVAEGLQKTFEGRLVGANRAKDLAVLKVDAPAEFLKPINLGQSSSLRVGQQCLAIGNPFGFDHTLTVGVISGLNRDISSKTGATIGGGIQTDAAINPGNSGGPLLDSKGNMIGINTAIFTNTGEVLDACFLFEISKIPALRSSREYDHCSYRSATKRADQITFCGRRSDRRKGKDGEGTSYLLVVGRVATDGYATAGASAGVGFAIPSSTVLRIVPQLIQFGKVVRAGLNAEIAPDPIANQLNVRNGALVLQVPGNSIAAQAGLLPTTRGLAGNIVLGDIIVAVNDKPVRSRADLLKAFEEYNVGDTVLLKIQRGNQSLELPLVLEETGI